MLEARSPVVVSGRGALLYITFPAFEQKIQKE
jgi:hypothetical protein